MFPLYRTLSLRYLRQRWALNSLIVLIVALGVALWVATTVLYRNLERSIIAALNPMAGFVDLQVSNADAGVPRSVEKALAAVPGVRGVRPMVIESVKVAVAGEKRQPALLLGLDLGQGAATGTSLADLRLSPGAGEAYLAARRLGRQPALVGGALVKRLPADSRTFQVYVGGAARSIVRAGSVEAAGALAGLGGNVLVMDCEAAARLAGRPGRASRLDIALEPGADKERVTRDLRAALGGLDAQVRTPEASDSRVRDVLGGIKVGSLICGAGALVVGLFLVYLTQSVSVTERRHDIGVLRSLGATRGQIRGLFQVEAVGLGLVGAVLGAPLGLGLAHLMLGPVRHIIADTLFPVASDAGSASDLGWTLALAMLAGLATSVGASLVPAMRAAREEPADAVRRAPVRSGWLAWAAPLAGCLALAAVGVLLMSFKEHLPFRRYATFAGLGAIFLAAFLGAALAASLLARLVRPATQALFPIEGRLAADNLVRAPGRTGLVVAALSACVALLAHTAGIIKSNEVTLVGWLERAITADLIVTSGGAVSSAGDSMPMSETVAARIEEQVPGAVAVPVSVRMLDWQYQGQDNPILVALLDGAAYHRANAGRPNASERHELFGRLAEAPGRAVVSDNFQALYGLGVGDRLTLPSAAGPQPLEIIGVIEDYSCPRGTVLLDRRQYAEPYHTQLIDIIDVYLPPGGDTAALRTALQQSPLAAEHLLVTLTGPELRDHISGMIRKLYGLAYLQEGVVGIVAAVGVVAALLIAVLQRRRELGLLRAVGATRGQVLRSVLFEALLMGLIGSALGVLIGLVLQWYALRVIMPEEAGFTFPVLPPWREAAVICALAIAVATLAGLLPAWRAVRLGIADAIAYE